MMNIIFSRVLELEELLKNNEKQKDKDLKFSKEIKRITNETLTLNKTLLAMFRMNEKRIVTKGIALL